MSNNMNPIDEFSYNSFNEMNSTNEIVKLNEVPRFNDFSSKEYKRIQDETNNPKKVIRTNKPLNIMNIAKMFSVVTAFAVTVVVVTALSASGRIIKYLYGDDYLSYDIVVNDIGEEQLFISISNSYYEEKRVAREGRNSGFFNNLTPNTYYDLKIEGTSEFGYKTYDSIRFKTTYNRPNVTITNLDTIVDNYMQLLSFDYIFSDKYESISEVYLYYKYGYYYDYEGQTIESIIYEDILPFDNVSKNYILDFYVESGSFFKYYLEYQLNGETIITEENIFIIPPVPNITYVDVFTEILEDESVMFRGYVENSEEEDLYLNVYNANDENEQYVFNLNDYYIGMEQEYESYKSFDISLANLNSNSIYNFEIKGKEIYYESWFIINDYYIVDNIEYYFNEYSSNANISFDFIKEVIPQEYNCSFGVDYIYNYGEQPLSGRIYFTQEDYSLNVEFPQGGILELKFFQTINGINQYKEAIFLEIPSETIRVINFGELYVDQTQQISFNLIVSDPSNQVSNLKLFYEIVEVYDVEGISEEYVLFENTLDLNNDNQLLLFDEYIYGGYIFRYHFEYFLDSTLIISDTVDYNISYVPSVDIYASIDEYDNIIISGGIFNNYNDETLILKVYNDIDIFEYDIANYLLPLEGQGEEGYEMFEILLSNVSKDITYYYLVEGNYVYAENQFIFATNPANLYSVGDVNIVPTTNPNAFNINLDVINSDNLYQVNNVTLNYNYETISSSFSDFLYLYNQQSNYQLFNEFTYGITLNLSISGEINSEIVILDEKSIQVPNPNKYYEINNLNYYFNETYEGSANIGFEFTNIDEFGYCSEFGYDYIYTHPDETFSGNIYFIDEPLEELILPVGGTLNIKFYQVINDIKEYKDEFNLVIPKELVVFNFNTSMTTSDNITCSFTGYNLFEELYYIKMYNYDEIEIQSELVYEGYNEVLFTNLSPDLNYTIRIVDAFGEVIEEKLIHTLPEGVSVNVNQFAIIEEGSNTRISFMYLIEDLLLINPTIKITYVYTDTLNEIYTYEDVLDNSLDYYLTTETFDYNTTVQFSIVYEYNGIDTVLQVMDIYIYQPM